MTTALKMRPVAEFDFASRRTITALLTDIDDTLTEAGRLPATAYVALERLKSGRFHCDPGYRPPGRVVRSDRETMAGGRRCR